MATSPKKAINPTPRKVSTSMPLMTISEGAAGILQTVSHVALITGSILALLGTIGVFWSQGVLSRYAAERQSNNELKTEEAKRDAAKAAIEVGQLQVVVAEAEQKRAVAEHSLLELQERIKPRRLVERQKFVEFLREYKPGPVEIRCATSDVEARNFASEINSALKEAGWKESKLNDLVIMFPQPTGLRFWIHSADPESIPDHAGALQKAFELIGVPVKGEFQEGVPKGDIVVIVGSKP